MSKIRLLPNVVANQIAAGEVVERPASIVKELLENSLDAGASNIEIEIEQGGKKLILIRDDGEGMTKDDALLAFERHSTSKIFSSEDLTSIKTFGFRGEALASIASVSHVELLSKLHDEIAGTELKIRGGIILSVQNASWPGGTQFTVKDLFFNVPARRKFLKTESTESYHITNLVTNYALANHECSFSLKNNGRETLRVTPTTTLKDRAYQLFGEDFLAELIEVSFNNEDIKIRGFASRPQHQRTSRNSQYFFVNGRSVKDRLLSHAVMESYRNVIPPRSFPSVMLFIEVDPAEVDVNVHPAKTEVRFRSNQIIRDSVQKCINASIATAKSFAQFPSKLYTPSQINEATGASTNFLPTENLYIEPFPRQSDFSFAEESPKTLSFEEIPSAPISRESIVQNDLNLNPIPKILEDKSYGTIQTSKNCGTELINTKVEDSIELLKADLRILGQLHNSYIVAVDVNGLFLVDQHVAHERVLFEQHLNKFTQKDIVSQSLLIPETFDLTPAQSEAFNQINSILEENGFDIMQLSRRTIAIRSIPAELEINEARLLLLELLDMTEDQIQSISKDHFQREIAAGLACRAAIKVNNPLTVEKMEWLLEELMKTKNPTNCPHGRPIILRFNMHEIEKGFKRI